MGLFNTTPYTSRSSKPMQLDIYRCGLLPAINVSATMGACVSHIRTIVREQFILISRHICVRALNFSDILISFGHVNIKYIIVFGNNLKLLESSVNNFKNLMKLMHIWMLSI